MRPSLQEPILYEDVNCIGTLRLLEAARRHGPNIFIFGSSSSVYGINEKVPFSEDDEVNQPISPYATTKRSGELLCYNYHHLYGFRTACLRFFTVYGPRQRPEMAIHKFTDLLWHGQDRCRCTATASSRRDYTYVDDIVDGMVASLDLAPGFEILNLGGADTTSLRDLVHWIAEELAVEPRIDYLPAQPGDVPITYADVSKAARLLGYSPKVPIREGLRRFVCLVSRGARRGIRKRPNNQGRAYSMNICVVGSGYVGLVTGACLADFGMHVVGVDKDHAKVEACSRARCRSTSRGSRPW